MRERGTNRHSGAAHTDMYRNIKSSFLFFIVSVFFFEHEKKVINEYKVEMSQKMSIVSSN